MKILLLAPTYLNLYKDVETELCAQGHQVFMMPDINFPNDPYLIREREYTAKEIYIFENDVRNYWLNLFSNEKRLRQTFDLLFVINGCSFSKILIESLRKYNNDIRSVLYLWDRTYGNYRFDRNFHYFDKVVTFDRIDSEKYSISFLPNYWVEPTEKSVIKWDVSGFGTYRYDRWIVFKTIADISEKLNLKSIIRMFHPNVGNKCIYRLKYLIKHTIMGHQMIPLFVYNSDCIVNKVMTPSELRNEIYSSKCVIDTNNDFQEGMTPRFMWALGAGCKIITTNKNIINYDFYDPKQIFVYDNKYNSTNDITHFLTDDFISKVETREIIEKYRIDNWIKYLLKGYEIYT